NASTFSSTTGNISSRTKTAASVAWSNIPAWTTVGEAGSDQQTPDISSIIQEIVDRAGWLSGNSLAVIIEGSGQRTAESYDGSSSDAPLLVISYSADQYILSRYDSDQGFKIWMNSAGKICFGLDDDSSWGPDVIVTSPSGYDDNTWHFFTAVKEANSFLRLYIDGIQVVSDSIAVANTLSVRVSQSSDDAEEQNPPNGSMYLTSSDLELVNDGSTNQVVGIRFQNVTIPQGATITNAYIQFTVDETDSVTTDLTIYGEDTDNASTFGTASGDISSRTKTTAYVSWNNIPAWNTVGEAGSDQQTPDISSIIQEIIDRAGWLSGNSLAVIIEGSGERTAESYNGSSSSAPLLVVNYTTPLGTLTSDSAPLSVGSDEPMNQPNSLSVRVSQSSDDAEEQSPPNGSMYLTSSDLELVNDGSTNQVVGIRFQNVTIPQGATITNAYIQFTVDETDSVTTDLTIYGEDTDNASTFGTASGDISSRTKTTAYVSWNNIPAWNTVGEAGSDQQTPDISSIIQEIIDRAGWLSGNSLAVIIEGSGERTAESYNGSSSSAPLLVVNYTTPNQEFFHGIVDEIRITNTALSSDWIKTCYNNQSSPSTFYSLGEEATLVDLVYFQANGVDSTILLEWKTASEMNAEGFNILRSRRQDGRYARINPSLIPSKGSAFYGAEYSFSDANVKPGTTYHYLLEEVDSYGWSTLHGPVSARLEADNTAPQGLTALKVTGTTAAAVSLSWSEVEEENFNHYEIWYGKFKSDVEKRSKTALLWHDLEDPRLAEKSTTATTITGLEANQTYYFKIWAVDDSGNEETVPAVSALTSPGGVESIIIAVRQDGRGDSTTIQGGIDLIPDDLVSDGNSYTVEIQDSNQYHESVVIYGKKTDESHFITLRAQRGESPSLRPFNSQDGIRSWVAHTKIQGLTFYSHHADGIEIHNSYHELSHNRFLKYINGEGYAINIVEGGENVIHHNLIDNYHAGIHIETGAGNQTVYNNIISPEIGLPLHLEAPLAGKSYKIVNNTIYALKNNALYLENTHSYPHTIIFKNNIVGVEGKGNYIIHRQFLDWGGMNFDSDYNHFHLTDEADMAYRGGEKDKTLKSWQFSTQKDLNSEEGDPLFISSADKDFRLEYSSPCIDRGVTLVDISDDFNGTSRPQGNAYDIGAYENPENITLFHARGLDGCVLLRWESPVDVGIYGYNILKSLYPDRDFRQTNNAVIEARGNSLPRSPFSFIDYEVENGQTYHYKLEEIYLTGSRRTYGPLSATPNDITLIWPKKERKISLSSSSSIFRWKSFSYSSYKVEISSDPNFLDSETVSFPEEGWTYDSFFWPDEDEKAKILNMARKNGGHLFWRVRAKGDHNQPVCCSPEKFEIKEFSFQKNKKVWCP
ncbi:MAG: right-handed parallel beta-helix repeat-containing protein, partial [Candidatus Aminicenantales bacterium]